MLALACHADGLHRHCADRTHPPDRHRQEERDHDDRFRARRRAEQGLSAEEAIYQACLLRFRPIMMTTLAAMLGALPMALGSGTGAELRRPLGICVVGGLMVSQVLTLYTTPGAVCLHGSCQAPPIRHALDFSGGAMRQGIQTRPRIAILLISAVMSGCAVGPGTTSTAVPHS